MTEEEAIKRLKELQVEDDTESAHGEADDIILSFCPKSVAEEYAKVPKWYA
jgi:hypothetical protein